jgi:hypothetical protein
MMLFALATSGCLEGSIRQTTTGRAAQEMLLQSTAAQRAALRLDARALRGRPTWVELAGAEGAPELSYLRSAVRERIAFHGVPLARSREEADVVLEVRVATLGTFEGDYGIGIPPLPVPLPPTWDVVQTPPYTLRYKLREGRAGLRFFAFDRRTGAPVLTGPRLWGEAYKAWTDDIWPTDAQRPPPVEGSTGTPDAASP